MNIGHSAMIDSALLSEARVTYSTLFSSALKSANGLWYQQLATSFAAKGASVKLPFLGGLTRMREWLGERHYQSFSRHAQSIVMKTYEGSVAVDVDDINDDQLDGYSALIQDLAYQAAQWPQDLMVDLIKANGIAWDGQNFFDTDHSVDPSDPTVGTYSNVFASSPLTEANLVTVMTDMCQIAGRDKRPVGFGKDLRIVVPKQLEFEAKKIVAAALGTNGGTNILSGVANVLAVPELGMAPNGSATTWYLADVGHAIKPLLFAQNMAPQIMSDDTEVFQKNTILWGAKSRGAAAYGMPFLMAKCTA